jgi:hypothetical protein
MERPAIKQIEEEPMSVIVTRMLRVQTNNYPAVLEHLKAGRARAAQRGGVQRSAWRRFIVGGPFVNAHYLNTEFESMSAWTELMEQLNADPDFQAYLQRGQTLGLTLTGTGIRRSLAHFGPPLPAPGRLASVVRTWQVQPGRMDEFLSLAEQVTAASGEPDLSVDVSQLIVGGENTGRVITSGTVGSLAVLGRYMDRVATNQELSRLFARATGPDSPAEMLTVSISVDVPV